MACVGNVSRSCACTRCMPPRKVSALRIVLQIRGGRAQLAPARDVDDASRVFRAWIEGDNAAGDFLGASDLGREAGDVYGADDALLGRVSYNGRWWPVAAAVRS